MFPLHLLLSPQSSFVETPVLPAKTLSPPVMARIPRPIGERAVAPKARRAAWALTWLPPETAIVPSTGINVPEMGQ